MRTYGETHMGTTGVHPGCLRDGRATVKSCTLFPVASQQFCHTQHHAERRLDSCNQPCSFHIVLATGGRHGSPASLQTQFISAV